MNVEAVASLAFASIAAFPIVAQIALALGAPWGQITMGGRWPGALPPSVRFLALLQAAILTGLAVIALDHGGWLDAGFPDWSIWIVVAVSCLTAGLNNITPSVIERRLWGLPTVLMAVAALALAAA